MTMIDLEEINGRSLMTVQFDRIDEPLNFDKLPFFNIIFAGDGQYFAINSPFGTVIQKFPAVKYRNLLLQKYEFDWAFRPKIKKAPRQIFEQILECFKYVNGKINNELLVIIYYDTIKKEHVMDIVQMQIVSGGSVDYAYNKKYEMDSRYIKYLEIHSHNSMGANFSGTDNNDESNRTMYFCGVLGKIANESNVYNVDQRFRIWTGLAFQYVEASEVFDGLEIKLPKILSKNKNVLDKILKISEIIKEKRNAGLTGTAGVTTPPFLPPASILPPQEEMDEMDDEDLDQLFVEWSEEGRQIADKAIRGQRNAN